MEKLWLRQYPPGVPHEIGPLRYASLAALLQESVRRFHDRPAFSNAGKVISFGDLDRASRDFAAYLQQQVGMRRGERIAVMMPNLLQYPIVVLAAMRAGLVIVNCNPLYTPRELHHQLVDSGATAIVVAELAANVVERAMAGTDVRTVIVTRIGDMLSYARAALTEFVAKHVRHAVTPWQIDGAIAFKSALAQGSRMALLPMRLGAHDVAFIQYTGGTTDIPKGAMLTHGNLLANLEQISAWVGGGLEEGNEIVVTALPLHHVFALTVNLLMFIKLGGHNVLITDPHDVDRLVSTIRSIRFTVITGVNSLFWALLRHPHMERVDTSALKIAVAGGAALSRDVARRWQVVTGRPLIEGYGLTEASPLVTVNRLDVIAYTGNVGLPMPSTEVTLRDDDGHAVGLGEPGEICVRGPQVMAGYWKRPDETAEVLDQDGWLRTGDIGVMDTRGYVTIADRKKDVIVVSGFKVFPHEVEEVAIGHPGVLEAAAVGTPDPKSGEAVTLVVVRKDPSLSARELMDHCARLLTMYKRPRKVTFREAPLPKSATGKTLRRLLRDEPAPVPEAQSLRDASPRSWSARVGRFQNDAGWRKRLQ